MAVTSLPLDGRRVLQNAYVVNDIYQSIDKWTTVVGLGPFFLIENVSLEAKYRGAPVTLELSVAMAQAGPINIELIQQHNAVSSCYRDVYRGGEEGFHHVCMLVQNFDQELRRYTRMGYALSLEADMQAYRFAYVDIHAELGCHVELVEDTPTIRQLYSRIEEAARNWDGSDPVRSMYPSS